MEPIEKTELNREDIRKLSSYYLNEGRKQESWQIDHIMIEDTILDAHVSMRSTYLSSTDNNEFHLTIFSALEFLSQLMIIYAHVWAGRKEKVGEGWMIESSMQSLRVIRDPDNILVAMTVEKIKERGPNLYCIASYQITDAQGGLMKVRLKGFLT
ncbi:MAG: hypothetical protein IE885_09160 [Campylobacterales bacterium]|nr:hypothetical protein [Campylobacterales bacterium]